MTGGRRLSEAMNEETVPEGKTMSRSKTSRKSLIAEEKRQKAIDLRRLGCTYREIADQIGASPGYSFKLVTQALKRIRQETNEIAEDARTLELERLDNLWRYAYQAVINGDVAAIDKAVKVMDRRARLLGLDAPSRQEISGELLTSPQWIELRGILIKTLAGHPEAQKAVLAAIAEKTEN
jgi:hypothetical protein